MSYPHGYRVKARAPQQTSHRVVEALHPPEQLPTHQAAVVCVLVLICYLHSVVPAVAT